MAKRNEGVLAASAVPPVSKKSVQKPTLKKAPIKKATRKTAPKSGPGKMLAKPKHDPGADITQRLVDLACDPVAIMAAIAMDEEADKRLRFSAAKELAGYLLIV